MLRLEGIILNKMKIAILEEQSVYTERLARALMMDYSDDIELFIASDTKEVLEQAKEKKIDLFLLDESVSVDEKKFPIRCAVVYLTGMRKNEVSDDCNIIYKYQHVDDIYSQIEQIYAQNIDRIKKYRINNEYAKLLLFVSAGGSTGCTTAAIACAKKLANANKKVLYLNYEFSGSETMYLQEDMTKGTGLLESKDGILFYPDKKIEDIGAYIDKAAKNKDYDYIVIDADEYLSANTELIKRLYSLVIVCNGNEFSVKKATNLFNRLVALEESTKLEILEYTNILYNKFIYQKGKNADISLNCYGQVPEFTGATFEDAIIEISKMDVFDVFLDL